MMKKKKSGFRTPVHLLSWLINSGEVPRGEKMLYSGTDPESYITEYTLVYEEKHYNVF